MIWKCQSCQSGIEIPDGTVMRFCPKCGEKIKTEVKEQTDPTDAQSNKCPVCCTEIQDEDETIICPDCKMAYHKDCWNENNGCATYGCPSAGVLNPPPMKVDVQAAHGSSDGTNNQWKSGAVHCPQCSTVLEPGATFCWSCGADLGGGGTISADASLTGPWVRWAARSIDYALEALICGFFLGILFNFSDVSNVVYAIIVTPFAFLLDSAVYAVFGNTLGKWVWGIKTIENSGVKVSAGKYFYRNLRVYWGGYGLGIPIVTLCTFVSQYNRVSKGQPSTYDEKMGLKSVRPNPSGVKTFFGVVLFILIFVFLVILSTAAKL